MNHIRGLTIKEIIFITVLHMYVGGFAFFWGASTNDPYLMIVFAFLVTQLIIGRVIMNVILQSPWGYRVRNRYIRLMSNFAVNVLIANLLMPLLKLMHQGDLAEFLAGPVIYGILFGTVYTVYFIGFMRPAAEIGNNI